MARPLALAAGLALLLACKLDPGGRCVFDSQCRSGLACSDGMCVVREAGADLGASCAVDSDCVSWGACRANVCVLEPGACVANGDCPSWQACGTDHQCALAVGRCASNADCVSWKSCSLSSYTCGLLPNRCDVKADCKSAWLTCDGSNTCVTDYSAGYCDATSQATQCAAWQKCDLTGTAATHKCVTNKPTYCDATGTCQSWQVCDTATTHTCVVNSAGGWCDADAQCQAWQICDATGAAATHRCAAAPGRCATTADCGPFRSCQSNLCVSPDGSDVLLLGELAPGDAATFAVSLAGAATDPAVGFEAGFQSGVIDAYGAIVYVDAGGALRRFVPDALTWGGSVWSYPSSPTANDPVIATPQCPAGAFDSDPGARWIVRGGTGEVLHSCTAGKWYDAAGTLRFTEPAGVGGLVAWSAGDAKLLESVTGYAVVDAAGAVHAVTGFTVTGAHGARTTGPGFWVSIPSAAGDADELWSIDANGVAQSAGTYAALPWGEGGWVIDESGRWYTWDSVAGKVFRRSPGGAAVETLYDVVGGASVWTTSPASWWVSAAGTVLLQGP